MTSNSLAINHINPKLPPPTHILNRRNTEPNSPNILLNPRCIKHCPYKSQCTKFCTAQYAGNGAYAGSLELCRKESCPLQGFFACYNWCRKDLADLKDEEIILFDSIESVYHGCNNIMNEDTLKKWDTRIECLVRDIGATNTEVEVMDKCLLENCSIVNENAYYVCLAKCFRPLFNSLIKFQGNFI